VLLAKKPKASSRARAKEGLRRGLDGRAPEFLRTIIGLGMELLLDIDWQDRNFMLLSMDSARMGVDLAI
jgi:hypothetical protein